MYLMKLKEKCGVHNEDGKIITAGTTFKTSKRLDLKFVNKFELIQTLDSAKEAPTLPDPSETGDADDTGDSGNDTAHLGENVTSDFELAEENDLEVYKKSKKWLVYDPEEEEIVEEGLKKGEVNDVIESYLGE